MKVFKKKYMQSYASIPLCMCCFLFCNLLCVNGYKNRKVKQENDGLSNIDSTNPLLNVSDEQILEQ